MVDKFFAAHKAKMAWVNRAAGALLVFVGVLMVTNYLTILSTWMQAYTPPFLRERL